MKELKKISELYEQIRELNMDGMLNEMLVQYAPNEKLEEIIDSFSDKDKDNDNLKRYSLILQVFKHKTLQELLIDPYKDDEQVKAIVKKITEDYKKQLLKDYAIIPKEEFYQKYRKNTMDHSHMESLVYR